MRLILWLGAIGFGLIGGYVPVAFGASYFSLASIAGNMVGGFLGIFLGYRLARHYGV